MPEGDGTVLDNSCLMFLSSLFVGRTHDNSRLPLVLAGGLGGTLKTGRSLNYLGQPAENRKMCSLYLSLMDRMGVELDHFGDADSGWRACRRQDCTETAERPGSTPPHPVRNLSTYFGQAVTPSSAATC